MSDSKVSTLRPRGPFSNNRQHLAQIRAKNRQLGHEKHLLLKIGQLERQVRRLRGDRACLALVLILLFFAGLTL